MSAGAGGSGRGLPSPDRASRAPLSPTQRDQYMKITIEATAMAPIADVWRAWTTPEDIKQWNAASTTGTHHSGDRRSACWWQVLVADGGQGRQHGIRLLGHLHSRRSKSTVGARSGRWPHRTNRVQRDPAGVTIRETFDAEPTHSPEQQREGWQAILNRFVQHVEANRKGDA